LPLARSLKRLGSPDVGIEDVTLIIGYYNNPTTSGWGFDHLAEKWPVCSIVVAPLLADGKWPHLELPAEYLARCSVV
jgi:hypothetical protein